MGLGICSLALLSFGLSLLCPEHGCLRWLLGERERERVCVCHR
jgi:hypothetical protein